MGYHQPGVDRPGWTGGRSVSSRVELYGSIFCPYCWKAKGLLRRNGVEFVEIPILMILGWKLPTARFREMVDRAGGERTIPQIFVDGRHLGDEETLEALERQGQLDTALGISVSNR